MCTFEFYKVSGPFSIKRWRSLSLCRVCWARWARWARYTYARRAFLVRPPSSIPPFPHPQPTPRSPRRFKRTLRAHARGTNALRRAPGDPERCTPMYSNAVEPQCADAMSSQNNFDRRLYTHAFRECIQSTRARAASSASSASTSSSSTLHIICCELVFGHRTHRVSLGALPAL